MGGFFSFVAPLLILALFQVTIVGQRLLSFGKLKLDWFSLERFFPIPKASFSRLFYSISLMQKTL
jgi:hypothetical protein